MTETTRRTLPRLKTGATRPARPAPGETARGPAARRGGVLAAIALAASCSITTLLVTAGVAAGAGLSGSLELTIAAAAIPVTLLGWQVLRRARQRRLRTRKEQP